MHYLPEHKKITAQNVEAVTGFTLEQIIGMTGFWGHPLPNRSIEISGEFPVVKVKIVAYSEKESITVERHFNFKHKVVINFDLRINPQKRGIGSKVFQSQLKYLTEAGFLTISMLAHGGPHGPDYNGYITYARFGFTMVEISQKRFGELMDQEGREEKTINELLCKEEGKRFWQEKGFRWGGIFDLKAGSENWKLWKAYAQEKGLG